MGRADGGRRPVSTRHVGVLGLLAATLAATLSWGPMAGPGMDGMSENSAALIHDLRVGRTIMGALVGACLAAAGVGFQALLRNPLASPYTLGVSGGASLGAVVAMLMGWQIAFLPGASPVGLCAAAGALLAVGLVYALGRRRGALDTVSLLLAGVTLNFFFGALILGIQHVTDPFKTAGIVHWLMGSLDAPAEGDLAAVGGALAVGLALLAPFARDLNLLAVGEETARSLGVRVGRTRTCVFLGASLLSGAAVAVAGPIGFVGLIVPHALRLLLGPDNRLLLPAAVLGGAAFLAVCDTAARASLSYGFPVGVVTALLGGPLFVLLLRLRRSTVVL